MAEMNEAKIRKVAIVPHLKKEKVGEITLRLVKWLEDRGIVVVLSAEEASQIGRGDLAQSQAAFPDADLVVSLGGDGTILRSARLLRGRRTPILGINLGTLGFLTAVELDRLFEAMEKVLKGEFSIDERMMLECEITFSSGERSRHLALNEVVVERGERQRMVPIEVRVNGAFFNKYTADGLILATPTGSTAYSFSAGGPVVAPNNEVTIMTPISPHSLFGRSVILNPKDRVEVKVPSALETVVGIDGVIIARSDAVTALNVRRAEERTLLARVDARDFYATFREKLRYWDFWTEMG